MWSCHFYTFVVMIKLIVPIRSYMKNEKKHLWNSYMKVMKVSYMNIYESGRFHIWKWPLSYMNIYGHIWHNHIWTDMTYSYMFIYEYVIYVHICSYMKVAIFHIWKVPLSYMKAATFIYVHIWNFHDFHIWIDMKIYDLPIYDLPIYDLPIYDTYMNIYEVPIYVTSCMLFEDLSYIHILWINTSYWFTVYEVSTYVTHGWIYMYYTWSAHIIDIWYGILNIYRDPIYITIYIQYIQ